MSREHIRFDYSDNYSEIHLTDAVETIQNGPDEWMAVFDRYAAGSTSHELPNSDSAVLTLIYTAGFPGKPNAPEGVPQNQNPAYSLQDANCERGNNGPFYVFKEEERVGAELELGRQYLDENQEWVNERGGLVLGQQTQIQKAG